MPDRRYDLFVVIGDLRYTIDTNAPTSDSSYEEAKAAIRDLTASTSTMFETKFGKIIGIPAAKLRYVHFEAIPVDDANKPGL